MDNSEHHRTVKTYVMRSGRMTAAQERSYKELAPVWCIPFENKKLNFIAACKVVGHASVPHGDQ